MSALDDMEEKNEKAAYERGYSDGAAQAREEAVGVQETAMRMYSLMVEVKQENTDEFMEYYEMRMHEFEKSLGIRSRTGGEP